MLWLRLLESCVSDTEENPTEYYKRQLNFAVPKYTVKDLELLAFRLPLNSININCMVVSLLYNF